MVKQGKDRSAMFSVKYDPYVFMLRIKRLQALAKTRFVDPALQHQIVDENIQTWLTEFPLAFGKKGTLFDYLRKIVWDWPNLTEDTKTSLHEQWIEKGLPEEIWLKLDAKSNEITSFHKTLNSHNIIVTYEVDCFPYPKESVVPPEDILETLNFAHAILRYGNDYLESHEIFPVSNEPYIQNAWRQKKVNYGDCDYSAWWSQTGMDEYPTISLIIETVQPLICEKLVSIFAHLTDPYQSPFDKSPSLSTSYDTESGSEDGVSKILKVDSSQANITLAAPSKTSAINISYTTEVS